MDQKQLLRQIRAKLSQKIKVEKVFLFGSRATGASREDSDYDIAVISTSFKSMTFSERQRVVRPLVREVLGIKPLDVVCYTPEEYEKGKKAFLPMIIEEEGIAVP